MAGVSTGRWMHTGRKQDSRCRPERAEGPRRRSKPRAMCWCASRSRTVTARHNDSRVGRGIGPTFFDGRPPEAGGEGGPDSGEGGGHFVRDRSGRSRRHPRAAAHVEAGLDADAKLCWMQTRTH